MRIRHFFSIAILLLTGVPHKADSAEVRSFESEDVAIIIGNKTYLDQDIPEVSFAQNDARAMRLFVKNMLHIRDENILFIEDATQAKMETAFGRKGNHRGKAFQYVKPDVSNLYVFYSGHGVPGRTDGKSYLLPVDADVETVDINGYPIDVLYENLAQVEAKSVTIFLDACFSGNSQGGTLIKQASGAQILPSQTPIPLVDNMTIITAASQDQLASWDGESKHGLFTEYLLRALYGQADKDKDGEVRLAEVAAFLKQDMRYKARRSFNRDQVVSIKGDVDQVLSAAVNGQYPKRPDLSFSGQGNPQTPKGDLDLIDQDMRVLKNANVREKADVFSQRIITLSAGEKVHVAGKVRNEPWYALKRNNLFLGYVYAPLLGRIEGDSSVQESKSLRELKNRLARLEEQTKLESNDILPAPPRPVRAQEKGDLIGRVDSEEQGPAPNWAFDDDDPYERIEKTLKTMGALLARQSFIRRSTDPVAETRLNYNWVKIQTERCSLSASLSLKHDLKVEWNARTESLNIHDRQIEASFWRELRSKKRSLTTRDADHDIVQKVTLYQYGPFSFKNKKERRQFRRKAKELRALCPQPRHVQNDYEEEKGPIRVYRPRPARPDVRNPPPPPRFKRPPPPRR